MTTRSRPASTARSHVDWSRSLAEVPSAHAAIRSVVPALQGVGETLSHVNFSDYDTRLAAYAAVVDDEKRLLLAWWNGEGRGTPGWSMPGGGVEFDESLTEAVEREVLEETGYLVEVGLAHRHAFLHDPRWWTRRPSVQVATRRVLGHHHRR
jgi:8-oxo-dGTP pyrophosphatase MutT (NUDIX family)